MAQPGLRLINLGKVSYVILCLEAKWTESSLTFVSLLMYRRFVAKLLENMVNSLWILNIYIIHHNARDLLLLGYLSAHSSAVVVALSKQPRVLNKLTLVTKPKTHRARILLLELSRLLMPWRSRWLDPGGFISFRFVILVCQVDLIKLRRWNEDVGPQRVEKSECFPVNPLVLERDHWIELYQVNVIVNLRFIGLLSDKKGPILICFVK